MKQHPLLLTGRIVLGGLFLFEALNFLGILHFTLEFTWLGLMLTSGFVWGVSEWFMHKYSKEALAPQARGYMLLGAAIPVYLDALGDMNLWYNSIPHYDKYLHFFGGFAAALLSGIILYAHTKSKKRTFTASPGWLTFFTFTTATFLGALYEMEEYLEDVFTGSKRSGGGPDTAGDLTCDVFGALIISLILWRVWLRYQSKKGKTK